MLVVSDASPINALVRIGHVDVLGVLFREVVVPTAVARELTHERVPSDVRAWLADAPRWLSVQAPRRIEQTLGVDLGEAEAISLARELRADLLLVDDRDARRAAVAAGLTITGTLGILGKIGTATYITTPLHCLHAPHRPSRRPRLRPSRHPARQQPPGCLLHRR